MKAIIVQTDQEDRPLVWQEAASPQLDPGEVLVDVYAAGVNRADLSQRAGSYPPPPGASDILGLEMAGRVAEIGAGVEGWKVGDRVCALLAGGGYAEKVNVPQEMLIAIPESWSFEEAAAVPEVFLTAFLNLFLEAGLKEGETVLIHGGASGVGTAAIQLARETGCRVFVTAGSDEKTKFCLELGAELAVNYRKEDFAERIDEYTAGEGVDVVLDMVGASYLGRNLRLLTTNGRLVFIATLGGSRAEIDIRTVMAKRLLLKGSTLRSRPLEDKAVILQAFMEGFWPLLEEGKIRPIIDCVYPIEEAEQAHATMLDNKNIGKLILKVRD